MKPICLKIKGINSFIEEQVIDFEKLTSAGLFGIFGPTGSGKTTILDGITLALYGKISRESKNFVNTNCKSGAVSFEFQITESTPRQYLVQREFKIDKDGGCKSGKCKLLEITHGQEAVLEEQKIALDKRVQEIIGLNLADFSKTVVIPQGKFSDFLNLTGEKRRAMLERLFNLEQYGEVLASKIKIQVHQVEQDIEVCLGKLGEHEGINDEALNALKATKKELETKLVQVAEQKKSIQKKYDEIEEVWKLQGQLKEQEKTYYSLLKQADEYAIKEQSLNYGKKANQIQPYVEQYYQANQEYRAAQLKWKEQEQIYKDYLEQSKDIEPTYERIKQEREENRETLLQREVELKAGVQQEKQLKALEGEIKTLKEELVKFDNLEELKNKIKGIKEELVKVSEQEIQVKNSLDETKVLSEYRTKVAHAEEKSSLLGSVEEKLQEANEVFVKSEKDYEDAEKDYQEKKEKLQKDALEIDAKKEELSNLMEPITEKALALMKESFAQNAENQERRNAIGKELRVLESELPALELERNLLKVRERDNLVHQLRSRLNEGDTCPVCSSHIQNISELKEEKQLDEYLDEKEVVAAEQAYLQNLNNQGNLKIELAELKEYDMEILEIEEKKIKELEQARSAYLTKKGELETYISENENNLEVNNVKLKSKETDVIRIEQEVKRVRDKIADLKKDETSLQAQFYQAIEVVFGDCSNNRKENLDKITEEKTSISERDLKSEKLELDLEHIQQSLEAQLSCKQDLEEKYNKNELKLTQINSDIKNKSQTLVGVENTLLENIGMIEGITEELSKVSVRISAIETAYKSAFEEKEVYRKKRDIDKEALQGMESGIKGLKVSMEAQKGMLETLLSESEFESEKEVLQYKMLEEQITELEKEIQTYQNAKLKVQGQIEGIHNSLAGRSTTEEDWTKIQEEQKENNALEQQLITDQGINKKNIKDMDEKLFKIKEYQEDLKKKERKKGLLSELQSVLKGKKFVEFVATRRLRYICKDASKRLFDITNGDFSLELDEQSMFAIKDHKNGGAIRSASSLSGGETFKASLALALSLSAEIQLKGTAPLELFFLDEGFGTLDEEALDTVMTVVEGLHHKKLKVGIISHVESIKNRVPIQLQIQAAKSGVGSRISIEYS